MGTKLCVGFLLAHAVAVLAVSGSPDARYGFAFGANTQHQLGIELNKTLNAVIGLHPQLAAIFGSTSIVEVSSGPTHTLARTGWGSLYRWGTGERGQLGGRAVDNTIEFPTMLLPFDSHRNELVWASITSVAAGALHSIAADSEGRVFGWGDNSYLQLGEVLYEIDPSPSPSPLPLPLNHSHNRTTSGYNVTVRHSKYTTDQQQQQESNEPRLIDHQMLIQHGMIAALESSSSSMDPAPQSQSQSHETKKQVSFVSAPHLIHVPSLSGIASVHAAMHRSALLTKNGQVWVWGDNSDGLIGADLGTDLIPPTRVSGKFGRLVQLAMGGDMFAALEEGGEVWVWGNNDQNQLGLSAVSNRIVPAPARHAFFTGKSITNITAGLGHFIAWSTKTKQVFSFGNNEFGQLGANDYDVHECPLEIESLRGSDLEGVTAGRGHNIVLTRRGGVYVWGLNNQGQLGLGDTTNRAYPTRLIALESRGLIHASAGQATSFVWTDSRFPNQDVLEAQPPRTGAVTPDKMQRNTAHPLL